MSYPEEAGHWRATAGFSLVELIVTLTIAAVLLAATAPSFIDLVRDNRVTTGVNLLLADLHLARLEAIKRNRDVVICRTEDGRRCSPSTGARADWSSGRIIYVNTDGDRKRDPGEALLRVRPALPDGVALKFNQWWRLIYHGDGGARNGSFVLCDTRGADHARALIVYYTGRPRISDRAAGGSRLDCG